MSLEGEGAPITSPGFIFDLWEQAQETGRAATRAQLHHGGAAANHLIKARKALDEAALRLKLAHEAAERHARRKPPP